MKVARNEKEKLGCRRMASENRRSLIKGSNYAV